MLTSFNFRVREGSIPRTMKNKNKTSHDFFRSINNSQLSPKNSRNRPQNVNELKASQYLSQWKVLDHPETIFQIGHLINQKLERKSTYVSEVQTAQQVGQLDLRRRVCNLSIWMDKFLQGRAQSKGQSVLQFQHVINFAYQQLYEIMGQQCSQLAELFKRITKSSTDYYIELLESMGKRSYSLEREYTQSLLDLHKSYQEFMLKRFPPTEHYQTKIHQLQTLFREVLVKNRLHDKQERRIQHENHRLNTELAELKALCIRLLERGYADILYSEKALLDNALSKSKREMQFERKMAKQQAQAQINFIFDQLLKESSNYKQILSFMSCKEIPAFFYSQKKFVLQKKTRLKQFNSVATNTEHRPSLDWYTEVSLSQVPLYRSKLLYSFQESCRKPHMMIETVFKISILNFTSCKELSSTQQTFTKKSRIKITNRQDKKMDLIRLKSKSSMNLSAKGNFNAVNKQFKYNIVKPITEQDPRKQIDLLQHAEEESFEDYLNPKNQAQKIPKKKEILKKIQTSQLFANLIQQGLGKSQFKKIASLSNTLTSYLQNKFPDQHQQIYQSVISEIKQSDSHFFQTLRIQLGLIDKPNLIYHRVYLKIVEHLSEGIKRVRIITFSKPASFWINLLDRVQLFLDQFFIDKLKAQLSKMECQISLSLFFKYVVLTIQAKIHRQVWQFDKYPLNYKDFNSFFRIFCIEDIYEVFQTNADVFQKDILMSQSSYRQLVLLDPRFSISNLQKIFFKKFRLTGQVIQTIQTNRGEERDLNLMLRGWQRAGQQANRFLQFLQIDLPLI